MGHRDPIRLALDMLVLGQGVKSGVYRLCDELFPRLAIEPSFRPRYILPHRFADVAQYYLESRKLPGFIHNAPPEKPSLDADILLSPYNRPSESWINDAGLMRAQIINDIIPILRPEFFSKAAVKEMYDIINGIDRNTLVFAISESTKKDLLNYRPDLSNEQITVMPLAASSAFRPCSDEKRKIEMRKKYGIPPGAPYFLSLATLEIRKNIDQVVRSFINLLESRPQCRAQLVLSGMRGWKLDKLDHEFRKAGQWRNRIILTGFVDEIDLPVLYSDAHCFVYLSHFEGFGLPVLEAMACGLPVICANNSSLPEVVGDAGIMLNADDTAGVVDAMDRLLTDKELSITLKSKGLERSQKFTWKRSAGIVADKLCIAYKSYHQEGLCSAFPAPNSGVPSIYSIRRRVRSALGYIRNVKVPILRCRQLAAIAGCIFLMIGGSTLLFWPLSLPDLMVGIGMGTGSVYLILLTVKKIKSM